MNMISVIGIIQLVSLSTSFFPFRSDSVHKNQDLEFDRNKERFQFLKV